MYMLISLVVLVIGFRIYLHLTDQHVNFHAQNLSPKGKHSILRYGRCWWYLNLNDENKHTRYPSPTLNLNWSFFESHWTLTHIGFDFAAEEEDFDFYIGLWPLFSFHVVLEGIPFFHKLFRDIRTGFGYQTSVTWSDGTLRIHFIHDESWGAGTFDRWWIPSWIHVWTSARYKDKGGVGFYVTFLFDNLILGRMQHEKVELWPDPIKAEIPIEPDNSLGFHYFGSFMAERHSWWRQYFPWFKRIHHYVDIRVDDPPLHSGKGENSWDLDDDGIFGMGEPGTTLEEAIAGYQDAVRRDREKYGMSNTIYVALRQAEEKQIEQNIRAAWKHNEQS